MFSYTNLVAFALCAGVIFKKEFINSLCLANSVPNSAQGAHTGRCYILKYTFLNVPHFLVVAIKRKRWGKDPYGVLLQTPGHTESMFSSQLSFLLQDGTK